MYLAYQAALAKLMVAMCSTPAFSNIYKFEPFMNRALDCMNLKLINSKLLIEMATSVEFMYGRYVRNSFNSEFRNDVVGRHPRSYGFLLKKLTIFDMLYAAMTYCLQVSSLFSIRNCSSAWTSSKS